MSSIWGVLRKETGASSGFQKFTIQKLRAIMKSNEIINKLFYQKKILYLRFFRNFEPFWCLKNQLLKFIFSKKATKIDEIFTVDLTLCSKFQIDGEDFVNLCGLLRKHEL